MLEIGQFFKKNGMEYGYLDKINHNGVDYLFFSIEKNGKLEYRFYIDSEQNENGNYNLKPVEDMNLFNELMEIEEEKMSKNGNPYFEFPETFNDDKEN